MLSPNSFLRAALLSALAWMPLPTRAVEWSLDASWGGIGQALAPVPTLANSVSAAATQSDGKVIVAGIDNIDVEPRVFLTRFQLDGTVDSTWGNGGIVRADPLTGYGNPMAVAVQSDGKVLLATANAIKPGSNMLRVARFTTDGTPDLTFNTTGAFTMGLDGGRNANTASLALQADGKIVVATSLSSRTQFLGLVRLTTDGQLDSPWGDFAGIVTGDFFPLFPTAVLVQADGKILVAGRVGSSIGLARFHPDGALDSSFGSDGKAVTDVGFVFGSQPSLVPRAIVVRNDGKILVGGSRSNVTHFFLVRFNANGALESPFAFERGGLNFRGEFGSINALALQPDGKIVAAGMISPSASASLRFALFRCSADGVLDPTFDQGGLFARSPGYYGASPNMFLQPDGSVLLPGYASEFVFNRLGLLRVHEGKATDPPIIFSPQSDSAANLSPGPGRLSFALPEAALADSLAMELDDGTTVRTLRFSAAENTEGKHAIVFNDVAPVGGGGGHIISGEPIPEGVYTVRLSYRDTASNPAATAVSQRVAIDHTPPTLDLRERTAEAQGFLGANVHFGILAVDNFDPAPVVTTSKPDGGHFFPGVTTVQVTATDAAGNKAAGQFIVRVVDTIPPTAMAPPGGFTPTVLHTDQGRTASLPSYAGQVVAYDAVGVNRIDQQPEPGQPLGEGPHEVMLIVRDLAGHTATVSFTVTVRVEGTMPVAWSGLPVPGAGTNPRLPAGSRWGTFGIPSITLQGQRVGWLAQVRPATGPAFHGIFLGTPSAPALRLRTGDDVTNADAEIVARTRFGSFREPVFAGEDFAVTATTVGARVGSGIWCGSGDQLREVARTGQIAPGLRSRFTSFPSIAMPAPGIVFFLGALDDATTRDRGLWVWTVDEGTHFILREGAIIPAKLPGDADDTPLTPIFIQSFTALNAVAGSPGQGRYDAVAGSIDVRLRTSNGEAIGTVGTDAVLRLAATAGSGGSATYGWHTPSVPSARGFGMPCSRNGGPGPVAAILTAPPAGRVITDFGFTPSTPILGGTITSEPVAGFDASGLPIVVFVQRGTGTASTAANTLLVTSGDENTPYRSFREIASDRRIAPEGAGAKWRAFTSLSILDGRGPLFTATLAHTTVQVTSASDTGLWATRSNGQLDLLLRHGDSFAGRIVRDFDALGSVAGSPGQRRAWTTGDESGRVIYRVSFTDGTSAIVSTAIP
jgi:uncharacterized delta-60 repeat protein